MWKETGNVHILATGKLLELYEKEYEIEGKRKVFENVRRPPGVRLIIEKDNKILLTKEYRSETKGFDVRLPGGKVFDRISDMKAYEGEMIVVALDAAIIEAREECGIEIKKEDLELFRLSHCGATIEWDLYYFIVRNFTLTGKQDLGEGEYITFEWYTKEELTQFVMSGEFSEDRTKGILWEYFLTKYE
ncbi:NUDIX domain-containing protein [Candidatus Gracilibacteria bacterium]|nr:NUDIX domain-containing protein [Candidatus Gracilibacteria bacterium]